MSIASFDSKAPVRESIESQGYRVWGSIVQLRVPTPGLWMVRIWSFGSLASLNAEKRICDGDAFIYGTFKLNSSAPISTLPNITRGSPSKSVSPGAATKHGSPAFIQRSIPYRDRPFPLGLFA